MIIIFLSKIALCWIVSLFPPVLVKPYYSLSLIFFSFKYQLVASLLMVNMLQGTSEPLMHPETPFESQFILAFSLFSGLIIWCNLIISSLITASISWFPWLKLNFKPNLYDAMQSHPLNYQRIITRFTGSRSSF